MALETFSVFSMNQTPADGSSLLNQGKSLFLFLTNALLANGWTHVQSSNGVTTSTSSNLITNAAAVVFATGNSAHSWITLLSPEGCVAGPDGSYLGTQSRIWFTLSAWATTAVTNGGQYFRTSFHNTAPTGGTITADPISPNQCTPYQNATNTTAAQNFTALLKTTYTTGLLFNFCCDTQGHFIFTSHYTGAGLTPCILALLPIKDVVKSSITGLDYAYPVAMLSAYDESNGSLSATNVGAMITNSVSGGSRMPFAGWNADGSYGSGTLAGFEFIGHARLASTSGNYQRFIAGIFSATGDTVDTSIPVSPIYVMNPLTGKQSMIGRVPDVYITGVPATSGTVDSPTSPTMYLSNIFMLPTNTLVTI